jgi:hypothetical protein
MLINERAPDSKNVDIGCYEQLICVDTLNGDIFVFISFLLKVLTFTRDFLNQFLIFVYTRWTPVDPSPETTAVVHISKTRFRSYSCFRRTEQG